MSAKKFDVFVRAFVRALRELLNKRGGFDFEIALRVKRCIEIGGLSDTKKVLAHRLALSQASVEKFVRMANALSLLPDRGLWSKIGWPGIRLLLDLRDEDARVAVKEIHRLAAKSRTGFLGCDRVRKVVLRIQPVVAPPVAERERAAATTRQVPIVVIEELASILANHPKVLRETTPITRSVLGLEPKAEAQSA